MFYINNEVYYVNDIGHMSHKKYKIKSVDNSLIILDASFVGKRGEIRNFEHHIEKYLAHKKLFTDEDEAITVSRERKLAVLNETLPYKIGDTIAWNNKKYSGTISEIVNNCYVIKLPMRHWSIDAFRLDIEKLF